MVVMKGCIGKLAAALCLLKKAISKQRTIPEPLLIPTPKDKRDALISTCDTIVVTARSKLSTTRTKRNVKLPVYQLPVEIIVEILYEALRSSPSTTPPSKALRNLRLVSVYWSKIIEGAAILWSITSCLDPEKAVTLAMYKSRCSTLHVSCVCSEKPERYNYAAKVIPFAKRWRSLTISAKYKSAAVRFLKAIAPNLQELSVKCTYSPGSPVEASLFEAAAPKLRSLEISKFPLPWTSVGLCGLHSLIIQNSREGTPNVQMMTFILECSPALQVLKLESCSFQPDKSTSTRKRPPIVLHSLQSLALSDIEPEALSQILDSIIYPDDTKLDIVVDYTKEWSTTVLEHAERQIAGAPISDFTEHMFCVDFSESSLKFSLSDKRVLVSFANGRQGWKGEDERMRVVQFALNHYFKPALYGTIPWLQFYSSSSDAERVHRELSVCHQALSDIRVLVTTYKDIKHITRSLSSPVSMDGDVCWIFPSLLYLWAVNPRTSDGLQCLVDLAEARVANGYTRPLHQLRVDGAKISQNRRDELKDLVPYVSIVAGTIEGEKSKENEQSEKKIDKKE